MDCAFRLALMSSSMPSQLSLIVSYPILAAGHHVDTQARLHLTHQAFLDETSIKGVAVTDRNDHQPTHYYFPPSISFSADYTSSWTTSPQSREQRSMHPLSLLPLPTLTLDNPLRLCTPRLLRHGLDTSPARPRRTGSKGCPLG